MSLRLRPRRAWRAESARGGRLHGESPACAHIYADLLDCPARDRQLAARLLEARGLSSLLRRTRPGYVGDYGAVFRRLRRRHGLHALARAGLLSRQGNLLFYRHRVLLPLTAGGAIRGVLGLAPEDSVAPAVLVAHEGELPLAARRRLDRLLAVAQAGAGKHAQLPLAFPR